MKRKEILITEAKFISIRVSDVFQSKPSYKIVQLDGPDRKKQLLAVPPSWVVGNNTLYLPNHISPSPPPSISTQNVSVDCEEHDDSCVSQCSRNIWQISNPIGHHWSTSSSTSLSCLAERLKWIQMSNDEIKVIQTKHSQRLVMIQLAGDACGYTHLHITQFTIVFSMSTAVSQGEDTTNKR